MKPYQNLIIGSQSTADDEDEILHLAPRLFLRPHT